MAVKFHGGKPYKSSTISVTRGYDIAAVKLHEKRRSEAMGHVNGRLHDGTNYVKFFCSETNLTIGLAGKTAQSHLVRDYYVHNIQIPPLTVKCEALNQEDYGNTVEFIRKSQLNGVRNNQLLQLRIMGSNLDFHRPNAKPMIRGGHQPIMAQGYVKSVPRKHERFVYAPKFEFEFIIVKLEEGIYKDKLNNVPYVKNMTEILAGLVQPTSPLQKVVPKVEEAVSETIHDTIEGLNRLF
jgi:hypothetical protein